MSYSNLDHAKPLFIQSQLQEERKMSQRYKKLVYYEQINKYQSKKASPLAFRGPSKFTQIDNGLIAKDSILPIVCSSKNKKILSQVKSPEEMFMALKKQQYSLIPQNRVQNDVSLRHPLGKSDLFQTRSMCTKLYQSLSIVQLQMRPDVRAKSRQ